MRVTNSNIINDPNKINVYDKKDKFSISISKLEVEEKKM